MTAMTSNDIQQQQQHNGQANEVESSLSFARKRSRNRKVLNPGALYDAEDDERSRNSIISQPNQERQDSVMMFRTGDFPQIGPMSANPSTHERPPQSTPCFSGLNGSYFAKRNSRKSKLLYSEIDKLYLLHRQQHPHRRLSNLTANRRPKLMPPSARRFPRSQGMLPPHLLSSNNSYQRLQYSYMQANQLPQRREFNPIHCYSSNGTKLGRQLSGHLYRANDHDDAYMVHQFVPTNRSGKVYANKKYNQDCNPCQDMAAIDEIDLSFDHDQEFEMQSALISNVAPEVRVISEKLHASENISVVTVDSGKCSTLSSNNTISLRSEPGLSVKAKESIVMPPAQVTESTSGKLNSFIDRNDARKAWPVITFGSGRPGSSVIDYHLLIVTKKDYDTSSLVTDVMTSNHVYTVHPLEKPEVLYNALQENLEGIAREFAKVIPHNPELDPRVSVEFISFDEKAREGPYLLLVGILNVEEPIAKEKVGSFVVILRGSSKGAKGIIKAINGDQVFVVMNHRGMSMKRWITRSNVKVLDELKILQHFENKLLRAKEFSSCNENASTDGQDNSLHTSAYRKDRQGMKGLDLMSKRSLRKFPGHTTRVASQGIDVDNDEISCDSFLYLYELTHEDKELRPLSSRDFDGKIASFMSKESSFHGSQREMTDNPKEDHPNLNHEAQHYAANQSTRNAKRHEEYNSISKPRPMESHVVIQTLSHPMESNVVIETQSEQMESNVIIENQSQQMESNIMIEDDSKKEDLLFEMLPPLSHARDEMDVELLRMEYQGNCDEDRQRLQIGQQLLASPSSLRFQVEKDLDHKATTYDKSHSREATFFSSHRDQADCFPKLISSAFATSRRSKSSNGLQRLADELPCPTHRKLRYAPALALGKRDALVEMSEGSQKHSNAFLLGDIQYDYPVEKNGIVPVNQPEEKPPERTASTHEAWSFLPPKSRAPTYSQRRFNKFTSVSKSLGRKRRLPLSSNRVTPPTYERRIETTTFDGIPIGSYSI